VSCAARRIRRRRRRRADEREVAFVCAGAQKWVVAGRPGAQRSCWPAGKTPPPPSFPALMALYLSRRPHRRLWR